MKKTILTAAVVLTGLAAQAAPYELDQSHLDVGFSVKHLMVSNTRGSFRTAKGTVDFDEAKKTLKDINVEIDVTSIDTRDKKRDDHLNSADFFETAKYPKATFKADSVVVKEGKPVKLKGDLTIKGVTKPVTMDLVYSGKQKDPWGTEHIGFNMTGKVSRKDYGMTYNATLDKGGVVIGDEVNLEIAGEIIPVKEVKKEAKN
jgi:polyisoprenoid-binding protein YceI